MAIHAFMLMLCVFAFVFVGASAWTLAKFYCRNKMGNPERAVSLPLAPSCSQSQSGICFILPAHGAIVIISNGLDIYSI